MILNIPQFSNGVDVRFDNFNNHHCHHHQYLCLDDVGIDGIIAGNDVSLNHLMMIMMIKMMMMKMMMRMRMKKMMMTMV